VDAADEYGGRAEVYREFAGEEVAKALPFYRCVGCNGAVCGWGFCGAAIAGTDFMFACRSCVCRHPLYERLRECGARDWRGDSRDGIDRMRRRTERRIGATIVQEARDFPHGWRDVMLADADGYGLGTGRGDSKQ